MIQGFFDESISDGQVLVLAGVLATAERWEEFVDEWQSRLDVAPWDAFKMSQANYKWGETGLEHAKWHYFTLRKFAQGGIAVAVPIEPLQKVVKELGLPPSDKSMWALDNPYMWAAVTLIRCTILSQEKWGLTEPVDFIFDERIEESAVRLGWEVFECRASAEERRLIGRKPIFEDDERVLPLQAADMWAWFCRRKWLEQERFYPEMGFPIERWGSWDDFPGKVFELNEESIRGLLSSVPGSISELAPFLKERGFLE